MIITQEQFNDAVLDVTGGPNWDIIKQGLSNDIYQVQASTLDANSWEAVCEAKGFAQGLAYLINLRENTIRAMDVEKSNADV